MDLNLQGKTAMVCGSTQGLGLACAQELALLGTTIVLVARNQEKLINVAGSLPTAHGQHHTYLVADFNNNDDVQNAVQDFISQNKIAHILINNTGGPAGGGVLLAAPADFEQAFKSHLINNQILIQALVPGMKTEGYGRIVNIISTSVKSPIAGLGVSNTIRAAVANWGKTLATELGGFGITVNNVLPGFTKTVRATYVIQKKAADHNLPEEKVLENLLHEIPAGRMGEPNEFGAAVAFLCSPAAAYINGINLPVDGGRLACL
ncbi:MAG: SDR family oxidoreductase [Ferruginibacter sp.]